MVRWRSTESYVGTVRYADPTGQWRYETESLATTDHVLGLHDLVGDTPYQYEIGSIDGATETARWEGRYSFLTAPPRETERPIRIWAIGDSGRANSAVRATRDAYRSFAGARHTDLWLLLGDNAYENGTDDQYQRAFFEIFPDLLASSVVWPTLGNHDVGASHSATQTGPYFEMFSLPTGGEAGGVPSRTEAYYSFDWGPIHFVCLDSSGSDRSADGVMAAWLERDLDATESRWLIAFWHHPPYSKGSHDSDSERELVEMREVFVPILERHGVDLVLAGHSHNFERSVLIDGHYGSSSELDESMILDAGDGRPTGSGAYLKPSSGRGPGEGTVYVVAGTAASTGGGSLDHPTTLISGNVIGSLVLDVSKSRLDAKFVDDDGTVRDSFSIAKGSDPLPGGGVVGRPIRIADSASNTGSGGGCSTIGDGPTSSGWPLVVALGISAALRRRRRAPSSDWRR